MHIVILPLADGKKYSSKVVYSDLLLQKQGKSNIKMYPENTLLSGFLLD